MIDHLLGRPSVGWKRAQVILVIIFWFWRILRGDPNGPRLLWLRRANRALQRFTPWQLIVSTLTGVYAVRNLDKILGLAAPEPLANLYSPSYYRATWIAIGLDAGFATAMSIRPRWLKDICSVLFSVYYIIYASEADEKIRKYRAVPTVEMLRTTWEKTTNPYLKMLSHHPRISIRRKIMLARPKDSTYRRPITTWLFFAPPADQLSRATDLVLDFPGGGFVSMTPEHHEERLRMWAIRTGKPVLSVDYGKAPEYPYPFSIDECFDLYRVLVETTGIVIGMSGRELNIICTGDSAGAHIACCVMFKILETQMNLPHPLALVLNYAALDFNFTSWMTPQNLRVLQTEQSSAHLSMLAEQKDHLRHISPLSMVGDRKVRRRRSLRDTLRTLASSSSTAKMPPLRTRHTTSSIKHVNSLDDDSYDEGGAMGDVEDEPLDRVNEEDKPLRARIRFNPQVSRVEFERAARVPPEPAAPGGQWHGDIQANPTEKAPIGTRLTMTSRTGYFQDRIISPSMMRAMAILYIGPHRNPDFQSDYQLSPILAPDRLLAQFPPLLMSCGEKDPFVDDTLIFAGRVREAKRARRAELERVLSSAGPGQHLRMTGIQPPGSATGATTPSASSLAGLGLGRNDNVGPDEARRALRREYERLRTEGDEDWVQMHIFSEWSHGYLQMPSLMREARGVIDDLADWMDDVFAGAVAASGSRSEVASPLSTSFNAASASAKADSQRARGGDGMPAAYAHPNTSPVSGDRRGASSPPKVRRPSMTTSATAKKYWQQGDTSATDETSELDTDEVLTFSPKRRTPPGSFASSSAGTARRPSSSHTETPSRVGGGANGHAVHRPGVPTSAPSPSATHAHTEGATPRPSGSPGIVHRMDVLDDVGLAVSTPPIGLGVGESAVTAGSGPPSMRVGSPPKRPHSQAAVGSAAGSGSGSGTGPGTPTPHREKGVTGGQTISESELMRRRRLLDSHLIPTDSVR
ncbi:alpha/beta-hydrolase [Cubamyces sp. BRFM 1775]|nr:alpha/beta-hydrolase [Cubamyces sp. BRFM 1775]